MTERAKLIEQLAELDEPEWTAVIEEVRLRRRQNDPPRSELPADPTRDQLARWYAVKHLATDPGLREVIYLPEKAPPNEIRLLEVNLLLQLPDTPEIEPIDFGVDRDMPGGHTLYVADITPEQWERVKRKEIRLPDGWDLKGHQIIRRRG